MSWPNTIRRDQEPDSCSPSALPGPNAERPSQGLQTSSTTIMWKAGKKLSMPSTKKGLIYLSRYSMVVGPVSLKPPEASSLKHHPLSPSEISTSLSEEIIKFQNKWLLMISKPPKRSSRILFSSLRKLVLMVSKFMALMGIWLTSSWSHGATREQISTEGLLKTDADLRLSSLTLLFKYSNHGKSESRSPHALDTTTSTMTIQPKLMSTWQRNSMKEKLALSKLENQPRLSQIDTNSQPYHKSKFRTFVNCWDLTFQEFWLATTNLLRWQGSRKLELDFVRW